MPFKPTDDVPWHAIALPLRGPRLIAIGGADLTGLPLPCRLRLLHAPRHLGDLTASWIAQSGLDTIAFGLFATGPDVWQIAAHLTRTGFAGRLFALSPALPNRVMVERELRAEFPALRLRVMPVLRAPT
jgi:hypothetical protein